MKFRLRIIAFLPAVLVTIIAEICQAEPDLLVYPTHVVLTDRQRTAQVDIVNSSQIQASYKISLVRKRMTETGAFMNVSTATPGEKYADELVKFSPRQVTLVPGAGQTVRMMFKVPPGLEEGEYRSHLQFAKIPPAVTELPAKAPSESNSFTMKITANIGVSIPVIVRHGNLDAKAAIDPSSIKLSGGVDQQQRLELVLARSGTRSIYGDVVAYHGSDKVAIGNGFSVYTPNDHRTIILPVSQPYRLHPGDTIRVVFTEKDGKKPMAETTVVLH